MKLLVRMSMAAKVKTDLHVTESKNIAKTHCISNDRDLLVRES